EILACSDPPIRMIWVTAGNPVSMLPDSASLREAFQRSEFNVVVDTHPTDTTDLAHLVLPTLTLLEDDDVLGAYGNHFLRASRPAVEPPGEARHELWIWQRLAGRLGLGDLLEGSPRDWKRRLLRPEVSLEEVERGAVRNPTAPLVLFADRRFPTVTGRVNLLTEAPENPVRLTPEYPLSLLAVSVPQAQSSQWSVAAPSPPEVRVHPDSAAGLRDGCEARLESRLGALRVVVRHDPAVHAEVALMAKGGMLRAGACANALVEARETDGGGGAAFYDQPVRLVGLQERAEPVGQDPP
ncbi:MAG: molybdopterin-dependent oxidoreductase, partial [Candidatus Eremiobacterota bacterium]